ncbi:hypothetical protein ES703_76174 [subsurface metagenome]
MLWRGTLIQGTMPAKTLQDMPVKLPQGYAGKSDLGLGLELRLKVNPFGGSGN